MTTLLAASDYWLPDSRAMAFVGPMWVLIGTIIAILIAAILVGRKPQVTGGIAMIGAILTGASCYWVLPRVEEGGWAGFAPGDSAPMLLADNFSLFFTILVAIFLAGVIGLWLIGHRVGRVRADMHRNAPEFFTLLLSSALGMVMMVSTTNLLMILIAIELASLPSYALAGFEKRRRLGAEAALKYVLFGGITSAIMVYGVSLLYGHYQSLDLNVIADSLKNSGGGVLPAIALFALAVGIAFKISAVPFHFWCPDVFEGAAIEVTTWLSVASKAAGLGLFIRVLGIPIQAGLDPASDFASGISLTVGLFAALTCTVANLAAFHQTNIKRLLAYSSIAHAGYMLMAAAILAKAQPDAAHPAFSALAAYLIVYLFMNLGAFGCAAMVYWATGKETLDAYTGLGRRQPLIALCMTIALVSLVGLPPLGGFAAKVWLLVNVWEYQLYWLVIVAVLNTAISLYYYVRVIRQMYLTDDDQPAISAPFGGLALVALSAVVILATGTFAFGTLREKADQFTARLYLGSPPAAAAAGVPAPPAAAQAHADVSGDHPDNLGPNTK